MIDWYLLLTPILMLAIIALVRFVGCNWLYGLEPTEAVVDPPFNLTANPGDQRVDLAWQHPPGKAASFNVYYRQQPEDFNDNNVLTMIPPGPGLDHSKPVLTLADGTPVLNGAMYCFEVKAVNDQDNESDPSNEVCVLTGVTRFVTGKTMNNLRSDFDGWVGITIQVGAAPLMVTALGRIVAPMNTQPVMVMIAAAANNMPLGSVVVSPTNLPTDEFAYANLSPAVKLDPFAFYYVAMQVQVGGDRWYDYLNTTVQTTAVASVTSAVFFPPSLQPNIQPNSAGHAYGPVDFEYYVSML